MLVTRLIVGFVMHWLRFEYTQKDHAQLTHHTAPDNGRMTSNDGINQREQSTNDTKSKSVRFNRTEIHLRFFSEFQLIVCTYDGNIL